MSIEQPTILPEETPEDVAKRLAGDLELSPTEETGKEATLEELPWITDTPSNLLDSANRVLAALPGEIPSLRGVALSAERSALREPGLLSVDIYLTEGSELARMIGRLRMDQNWSKEKFVNNIKTGLLRLGDGYIDSTLKLVTNMEQ
mgnify:CR=1 FL=1